MKSKTILFGILVFLASCTNNKSEVLDQAKKDSITKEIETALDQIIAGWNTKDINSAYPLFLKTSDFTMIGVDGTFIDYPALINMSKEVFTVIKDSKYSLVDKKIKIVDQNLVIVLMIYSADMTYSNGAMDRYPKVGCTLVFNRMDSNWIVTHFQESTLPPETVNPVQTGN